MVIFGDSHVHNSNPIFGSSCLRISVDPFIQIREYMVNYKEDVAIYLGDLTHLKDRVPTAVWNALFDEFLLWKRMGLQIFLLKGNHDFQNIDIFIQSFGSLDNVTAVLESLTLNIENYECHFLPFGFKHDSAKVMRRSVKDRILFIHDHINTMDYGYKQWTGVDKESIAGYRYVFAGHWHKFMVVEKGRVWHMGSPYQTNFAEVGQKKYFAVINDSKVEFKRFQYPKLIQIEWNKKSNLDVVKDKYVKIVIKATSLLDVNVRALKKDLMEKQGALGMKIDMIYEPKEKRKIALTTDAPESRTEDADYVKAYVKEKSFSDLNIKILTELGTEILKGG